MQQILVSGQHWNNQVTESDEKLKEITYLLNNFQSTDCPFCDINRENGQIIAQEIGYYKKNTMVDFSIVVLKIILFSCVHRFTIKIMLSFHFSVKMKI